MRSSKNTSAETDGKTVKNGAGKAVVITVAVILAAVLLAGGGAYLYAQNRYGQAYETGVPIVERTDDYSVNESELIDPPHVIETMDSPGTDFDVTGVPDETEEPVTDETTVTDGVTETDPAETTAPETEAETLSPEEAGTYVGSIPIYKVDRISDKIENVLFVGRDVGTYYGRADSAMIVSYNHETGNVRLVSLLRDSYVPIEGHNWNKLGHALSYGGMGLYINTVNYVLQTDIQKYAVVDFDGVKKIVDEVGGVDISLSRAEAEYYASRWSDVHEGVNHLNGERALAFARNRSLAGTDFARAERQRKVLLAVYDALRKMPAAKAVKTVKTMLGYCKTNVPLNEALQLAAEVFAKGSVSIKTTQMPFPDTWSYAYVKPPGYTGNLAVTKFDIPANRKALYDYLYNGN